MLAYLLALVVLLVAGLLAFFAGTFLHLHGTPLLVLHAIGMNIFDNCDLDALSEVAQTHKRWEFLLTAAPLPVEGGTGSPLNPLATY